MMVKMIIWSFAAALLVAADRISKHMVRKNMTLGESIRAIPGFDIHYTQNTGAAFSVLSGMTWLLGIVSVLFCIAVIVYTVVKKPKSKLLMCALTLIFAGALGNAIDRVFTGYVVDFIKTTFMDFAVFNVADIEITVGAGLLVLYALLSDGAKDKKAKEAENTDAPQENE